ncbi:MAG: hypothetical protein KJO69_10945 [Gammaproteobacteria bacterium]|nr:hypothetical protein [Gammaproteobacteria bacterium]
MEEKVGECPLGSQCIESKDGVLVRCPWYTKIRGKDPQSDAELDESRCAIAWLPLLMIEHSLFERQTGSAVESFRNEMVTQNEKLLDVARQERLKQDSEEDDDKNNPKVIE